MGSFIKFILKIAVFAAIVAVGYTWYVGKGVHHYTIKGDEVYDKETDLTWKRCGVGQQWSGEDCTGKVGLFSFEDAQQQGDGTWRVPTMTELVTLMDDRRVSNNLDPTIDIKAFPGVGVDFTKYWTSTAIDNNTARIVKFSSEGNRLGSGIQGQLRLERNPVRLVRSGH